jgi:hypothetical protein
LRKARRDLGARQSTAGAAFRRDLACISDAATISDTVRFRREHTVGHRCGRQNAAGLRAGAWLKMRSSVECLPMARVLKNAVLARHLACALESGGLLDLPAGMLL